MKRLDHRQLRTLVERVINEMPGRGGPLTFTEKSETAGPALDAFFGALEDEWMQMAEGDPSIENNGAVDGFDTWSAQVQSAIRDLNAQIDQAVESINTKLINGEYYTGE